jgi:hypothetical protein
MPTKKLTVLSIPTLAAGEWYDAVLPGLILDVATFPEMTVCSTRFLLLLRFPAVIEIPAAGVNRLFRI